MRLDQTQMHEITGRKRAKAQVEWFRAHLGADVPFDQRGPILSESTYEALLAKRLGVLPSFDPGKPLNRPTVRLVRKVA